MNVQVIGPSTQSEIDRIKGYQLPLKLLSLIRMIRYRIGVGVGFVGRQDWYSCGMEVTTTAESALAPRC